MKRIAAALLVVIGLAFLAGCGGSTVQGAAIGARVGAVTGDIGEGMAAGAAVGTAVDIIK